MQFFKLHIVDDYLSLFSKSLFFFSFFLYSYYNIHLHLLINCKWLCDSPIFNFTNRTILFSNFYYCYFRIIFFFLPIIQNFIFWIAIWPTRAFIVPTAWVPWLDCGVSWNSQQKSSSWTGDIWFWLTYSGTRRHKVQTACIAYTK